MPRQDFSFFSDKEEKAGYNQSGKITEILGNLRVTFISCIMRNDYGGSLESIRSIVDIIAGKIKEKDINEINTEIYSIEEKIPSAEEIYNNNGKVFYKNKLARRETKRLIEKLYRKLEKLQDKYGYGMMSAEDPRLAVLQR